MFRKRAELIVEGFLGGVNKVYRKKSSSRKGVELEKRDKERSSCILGFPCHLSSTSTISYPKLSSFSRRNCKYYAYY